MAKELGKLCPVGCAPYGHDFSDEDCPEHLVDHVWALGSPGCDWRESTGLILAMESELNARREKQWQDFAKLADVVADRRLFLGKLPPSEWARAEHRCEEWADWLHRHRHFGDVDEIGVVLMCGGGDWPFAGWLLRGDGSYSEVFRVERP